MRITAFLLVAGFWVSRIQPVAAADGERHWPQFRGPQASGVETAKALPTRWNVETKENVAWRTAVPGLAHAAPIVWGDRVYVTTAAGPGASELKVGLYGDISAADDNGPHAWRLLAIDKKTGEGDLGQGGA